MVWSVCGLPMPWNRYGLERDLEHRGDPSASSNSLEFDDPPGHYCSLCSSLDDIAPHYCFEGNSSQNMICPLWRCRSGFSVPSVAQPTSLNPHEAYK